MGYPRLCISENSKEFGLPYATSRFQHKLSSQQWPSEWEKQCRHYTNVQCKAKGSRNVQG